jgi:hypothetical protein
MDIFFISSSKIINKHTILSFILVLTLFSPSCRRTPHWDADISAISIPDIEIKRYETVLFNINPFNIIEEIDPHIDDFPLFLGDAVYTETGQAQLYDYITDPFILEIWKDTYDVWEDISQLENELTMAFRYFRYHFPQREIPDFFSYVSGLDFELPVKYYDNNVIIGLDMFLGRNYRNYERVGVPAFKRNRFEPYATSVEVMRVLAEDLIRYNRQLPETYLDNMIHEGKILYFLDCMMPSVADSLKISYTSQQLDWADRNQGQAWAFYLDNEMLYSTDRQVIQKFIGAAPFTAPFSRGSAPRMGVFTGWQIVREYMRRNPDVSLMELFMEKTAREILNDSRYRP